MSMHVARQLSRPCAAFRTRQTTLHLGPDSVLFKHLALCSQNPRLSCHITLTGAQYTTEGSHVPLVVLRIFPASFLQYFLAADTSHHS